jgi:hypothetical protein
MERENSLIKKYFNTTRLVELHHNITLTDDLDNSTLMNHHMQSQLIYPYTVVSVAVDEISQPFIEANNNEMTVKLVSRFGQCSSSVNCDYQNQSSLLFTSLPSGSPFVNVTDRYRFLDDLRLEDIVRQKKLLQLNYHQPVIAKLMYSLAPTFMLPREPQNVRQLSLTLVDFHHDMQLKGIAPLPHLTNNCSNLSL